MKLPDDIPDKLFYSIGEVGSIVGVKSHVLRYWETEFGIINPRKGSDGRRSYRKKDIERLLRIKELLYVEKYTIAGARRRLELDRRNKGRENADAILDELRIELIELKKLLGSNGEED